MKTLIIITLSILLIGGVSMAEQIQVVTTAQWCAHPDNKDDEICKEYQKRTENKIDKFEFAIRNGTVYYKEVGCRACTWEDIMPAWMVRELIRKSN